MKKIMNVAFKIFTCLLVAFTVFMMIFTILTVTTVDKSNRNILGFKFYIVQSDSMSLSDKNADLDIHFDAGDMIIVQNPKDPTALQPGDVIAFMSTNTESFGETITHMIYDVVKTDSGRVRGYLTYGTNTGTVDESLVLPEYVLGVHKVTLPRVGLFFAFVKSVPGYITCILVPFLILILYNAVNVVRLFRQNKREQMAVIQAEKDKIEQERAEAQKMMAELMALKAQLSQANGAAAPPAAPASEAQQQEQSPAATDET